jgi:hypothetical protein
MATREGVEVDLPQQLGQVVREPAREAEEPETAQNGAILGAVRQKPKALLSQKTTGEGTADSKPKVGKNKQKREGVDETSTFLRRGNGISLVTGTGGLEHLVPRWVAMEAMSTETAYKEPKESFTELLLELQSGDTSVEHWKSDVSEGLLRVAGSSKDNWKIDQKGLLHFKGAVYVLNDLAVWQEIMKMNHDNSYGGHFGPVRMAELIRRKYYWPTVMADIKKYVHACSVCQKTKAP